MKQRLYFLILAIMIITGIVMFGYLISLEESNLKLLNNSQKLKTSIEKYTAIKNKIAFVMDKIANAKKHTGILTIEEILTSIGIRKKLKTVKVIDTAILEDIQREDIEIVLTEINMNELVNFLHIIENGIYPLSIRESTIKVSFKKRDLLNLTLIVSAYSKNKN